MYEQMVAQATDDLLGNQEVRTVSRVRAGSVMAQLAQRVARETEVGVLLSLLTIEDVARMLGVTPRRVRARAQALNARGPAVGWQVPGTRQWLFRPAEVEILRPGPVGRPRKQS